MLGARLRQALAGYLEEYRGVRCGAHQIVVGAGLEYLLGLLAPLLPGPAAVENPGYPRAKQVLENNGVACCCLPVDEDGLSIRALSDSGAAVCYVTPAHQRYQHQQPCQQRGPEGPPTFCVHSSASLQKTA